MVVIYRIKKYDLFSKGLMTSATDFAPILDVQVFIDQTSPDYVSKEQVICLVES